MVESARLHLLFSCMELLQSAKSINRNLTDSDSAAQNAYHIAYVSPLHSIYGLDIFK